MAKEIILGIDLGTTNSVVSYLQADGKAKGIPNPEGTITTPFDMRVQNEIDRYHLVMDALKYLPQIENKSSFVYQMCKDKLVEHKQYITEYGQDLEEIRNWKW